MGSAGYNKEKKNRSIKNIKKDKNDNQVETNKNPISVDGTPKLYDSLPSNQYLCPYCGSIPELLNIFTDNGCIEFKCKCKGEMPFKVKDYFDLLSESKFTYLNTRCIICNEIQKDHKKDEEIFQYCYECKKDYCSNCVNKEEHPKFHLKKCIPVSEKKSRCNLHYDDSEYTSFCRKRNVQICNLISNKEHAHNGHDKINIFKIEVNKKVIIEKNKTLYNMIKFNELILNTYESFPNNYFHSINAANLVKSIELENERDSKKIADLFTKLERKIDNQNKALEIINKKLKSSKNGEKENLTLTGKEQHLSLINTNFTDEDLKSLIISGFSTLIDLNLSNNNLQNITYLKGMNTSYLKTLILNDNKIEDIGIFENLSLINLIELGLKNNKIKDVSPLTKSDLTSLELLRLDGNEIDKTKEENKKVISKFDKQIILVPIRVEDFEKKYNYKLSLDSKKLEFNDMKTGNEVLKHLYLISSNYDNTEKLDLSNCEIDDITYLSRISFKSLKIINLSVNKIENIEILPQINSRNLEELYLNDNKIQNITPLKSLKLSVLTIKNNEIKLKNRETQDTLNYLRQNNVCIDLD